MMDKQLLVSAYVDALRHGFINNEDINSTVCIILSNQQTVLPAPGTMAYIEEPFDLDERLMVPHAISFVVMPTYPTPGPPLPPRPPTGSVAVATTFDPIKCTPVPVTLPPLVAETTATPQRQTLSPVGALRLLNILEIARICCLDGSAIEYNYDNILSTLVANVIIDPSVETAAVKAYIDLTTKSAPRNLPRRRMLMPRTYVPGVGTIEDIYFPLIEGREHLGNYHTCNASYYRFSDKAPFNGPVFEGILASVNKRRRVAVKNGGDDSSSSFQHHFPLLYDVILSIDANRMAASDCSAATPLPSITTNGSIILSDDDVYTMTTDPGCLALRFRTALYMSKGELTVHKFSELFGRASAYARGRVGSIARAALKEKYDPPPVMSASSLQCKHVARVGSGESDLDIERLPPCVGYMLASPDNLDTHYHPKYASRQHTLCMLTSVFDGNKDLIMRAWQHNFFGSAFQVPAYSFPTSKYGASLVKNMIFCKNSNKLWGCRHALEYNICPLSAEATQIVIEKKYPPIMRGINGEDPAIVDVMKWLCSKKLGERIGDPQCIVRCPSEYYKKCKNNKQETAAKITSQNNNL